MGWISDSISAVAGLVGGKADRDQSDKAARRYIEADKTKIQTATKDAKAAGLHPLFALGAAGISGPSAIIGQSTSGSSRGDAIRGAAKIGTSYMKSIEPPTDAQTQSKEMNAVLLENAKVNLAKNKLDFMEMQSQSSINSRLNQAGDAQGRDKIFIPPNTDQSRVEVKKPEKIIHKKGDKGTSAATNPLFSKYDTGFGFPIWTLYSQEGPAEGLEGLGALVISAFKTEYEFLNWANAQAVKGILTVAGLQTEAYKYIKNKFKRDEYTPAKTNRYIYTSYPRG